MLLTGTDSLTYKIKAEYFYENVYKDKELLDSSNYAEDSRYENSVNDLVVVKTKDETSS